MEKYTSMYSFRTASALFPAILAASLLRTTNVAKSPFLSRTLISIRYLWIHEEGYLYNNQNRAKSTIQRALKSFL